MSETERFTTAWFDAALRARGVLGGGTAVTSARASDRPHTKGWNSIIRWYHLEYEGGAPGPRTVVLKLPSATGTHLPVMREYGFARREHVFYEELAAHCPVPTPRCYYSEYDAGADECLFVLDDIADAVQGRDGGASREQYVTAFEGLARFATTVASAPGAAMARLPWIADDPTQRWFVRSWPTFLAGFSASLSDENRALGDRLMDEGDRVGAWLSRPPAVLLHGDFRPDNLFFGDPAGERRLVAIDFGRAARGRSAADLAYLLAVGLDVEARRALEHAQVRRHHAIIRASGVDGRSLDEHLLDLQIAYIHVFRRIVIALGGAYDMNAGAAAAWATRLAAQLDAALVDNHAARHMADLP